ncbi:helix-turn-helix transcriptional regulator [Geobacter sp. OR-1]|uniref:helix-turn-helix domain-containing protein n=1 Tax=Geobacter sp. OR-1 TaxID=1266765 RepID=UPI0005AA0400|nr:helix-turn-helix domain-containing protein [Geobacter sp. OR-1]
MAETIDLKFVTRMKRLLSRAGSAEKLARLTGLSASIIGRYAEGKADPARKRLIAIAEASGSTVEWLATGNVLDGKAKTALKDVVIAVDKICQNENIVLDPSKKADLIIFIFEEMVEDLKTIEDLESKIVQLASFGR